MGIGGKSNGPWAGLTCRDTLETGLQLFEMMETTL